MANAWYAFYPGDYTRDTAHLSLMEDGAYRRLLDYYYSTAKPLPGDFEQLFRITRAFTTFEQAAVRLVLRQFFVLDGDLYRHARVDRELTKQANYRAKLSEGAHKTNLKRWGVSPSDSLSDKLSDSPSGRKPQPQSQPYPQSKPQSQAMSKACDASASRKPFSPPAPEDVATYCKERGGKVNPEQFHDFYSSNGWRVGRNPMRDWKSAVRTWERNESFRGKNGNGSTANRAQERLNDNLAVCAAVKRDFGLVS